MITDLWNLLIFNPMLNVLVFIYSIVGNYGIAIIIFTILIKLLTLPFSLKQQRSFKAQQQLQPEIEALKKKYGKDREKFAQEQMRLYKEKGINPLGGCLPMLIPWPLFIAFYQSVSNLMTNQPESFLELAKHLWAPLAMHVPVSEHFLWMNLSRPDPLYILPVLAVITTWIQQKMMTMASSDPQAQSMNQSMSLMMPLFTGWITLTFASGLGIYWVIFNIVGIVQQYFITGWGELARYIPPAILRRFPGPVPVAVLPAAAPEPKKPLRARRARLDVDETTPKRTARRRRAATAEDSVLPSSGDSEQAPAEEAAAPALSASLPARRTTSKAKDKKK